MLPFLFTKAVLAAEYSLAGNTLTIRGSGEINQQGVRSKGNHEAFKKVIIQNGPSSITKDAFYECYNLESISISETVLTISQCFMRCPLLSKITVDPHNPNYVSEQNSLYTFDRKKLIRAATIKSLTILDSVEVIGDKSFSVRKLFDYGTVVLPSSVTSIEQNAFIEAKFTSLSFDKDSQLSVFSEFKYASADKITLPKSITSIPNNAFYESTVGELVFEENINLEKIVAGSFANFYINDIKLPESVKEIESDAFHACSMNSITIGSKCQNINEKAFSGCGNLKNVIISPDNSFYKHEGGLIISRDETQIIFIDETTTSIRIPSKVTKIGPTMLQSASSLTEIVLEDTKTFNTESGVLYSPDFTKLIAVCGGVTTVEANTKLVTIGDFAASFCSKLISFTFAGSDVTGIGSNAFKKTSISSFNLPSTVKTIGEEAFFECLNLEEFNIPEDSSITSIGTYAFSRCPLKSIFIPENLSIIQYSFNSGNGGTLANLTFHPNSKLTYIERWSFSGSTFETLTFPAALKNIEFESFVNCKKLKTIRFVGESKLENIGSKAFFGCTELTELYLPPSCTTIENSAFSGCTSLKIVENSLTTILSSAFSNCVSLEDFNFSAKQTTPDPSVFQGCSNLKKFTVVSGNPNIKASYGSVLNFDEDTLYLFPPGQELAYIDISTEKFADNAFAWSTKLRQVAFPTGSKLTSIGESTFLECTALQYFQFPYKLATIQAHCFEGCSSLKKITLPESITTIGEYAFANCAQLRYVKYCGTNEVKGQNVFDQSVTVGVTEYYNFEIFCSVKVSKELTVDCELKVPKISCEMRNNFMGSISLMICLMIVS